MSENVLPMSFSRSCMFVNACFMYLGTPVLGAFMLMSVKSSPCLFSSHGIFLYGFVLKSVLSEIPFLPLTFNLCVSFALKWVSYGQHIVDSCLFVFFFNPLCHSVSFDWSI